MQLSSGAGNRLCIANESKTTDYVYVYSFVSYNRRGLSARSLWGNWKKSGGFSYLNQFLIVPTQFSGL